MQQKPGISVVIITDNQDEQLQRTVKSVLWAGEVLIIHDQKNNNLLNTAQNQKAFLHNSNIKVFERKLCDDFAQQRNFGLSKAINEWVLFVDSDEVISEKLASEIRSQTAKASSQVNGFCMKRKDYFMGKWLSYGETNALQFIRLARKDSGIWRGAVHEKWMIEGDVESLSHPLLHYPHKTLTKFLSSINSYTDILSDIRYKKGEKISVAQILFYPIGKFVHNYIMRLGILDGMQGLIMALMMSFHSFLVRTKIWQKQNQNL